MKANTLTHFTESDSRYSERRTSRALFRWFVFSQLILWTPSVNLQASSEDFAVRDLPTESIPLEDKKNPVNDFLRSLDFNKTESREIVERNLEAIQLASKAYDVPDWMIATIIYVETAQGLPNAWRWNDSASRDLFVGFGRRTSMGVMQVQQNPEEIGLDNHWQRMMFARNYQASEDQQIFDGTRHIAAVLSQPNRIEYRTNPDFIWSTHKLRVVAHEYNSGPVNWKHTTWEEARPHEYSELFIKFLPDAYRAIHGNDLTEWPLLDVPEELLTPIEVQPEAELIN